MIIDGRLLVDRLEGRALRLSGGGGLNASDGCSHESSRNTHTLSL